MADKGRADKVREKMDEDGKRMEEINARIMKEDKN